MALIVGAPMPVGLGAGVVAPWPLTPFRLWASALVLAVVGCLACWHAQAAALPQAFKQSLVDAGIPLSAVAVFAQRLDRDVPRLSVNAGKPFNPASAIKLVTTLAALEILGPAYTWRTQVWADGPWTGDVLRGDLALRGEGDPYFTPERLWQLLYGVRARGIRHIAGDVVLDASRFAAPSADRGDFDGRPHRAYNALPYALSLNFQAVHLTVEPDVRNKRLRVWSYPPLDNLRVLNNAKVVDRPCSNRYRSPAVHVGRRDDLPTVALSGRMSAACDEMVYGYLVNTPHEQMAGAFRAIWRQLGGVLSGRVRAGAVADAARLVNAMDSRPLTDVVWGVNKFSNNLMARHLLLTLAAEGGQTPATAASGVERVRSWLRRSGIDASGLVLANGSGLSRETRITADALGRILMAAYRGPRMPEFMASLPVVGVDGTMRQRLADHPVAGRAHIKTGSIDQVSAMGGYVIDRHDRRWAIVAMINHPRIRQRGMPAQDALLTWLFDGAP